jgi:predicted ATPase
MLFVINFVNSLHEEGLIEFSLSTCRWEFDLEKIKLRDISGDIAEHLTERISRLPKLVLAGMKIAACLGATFDITILERAITGNGIELHDFLSLLMESGFLVKISPHQYNWSHDQVHQAAYNLIPAAKRESSHLLIGSRIFLNTPTHEVNEVILEIVQNMNVGVRLLKSQEQKNELAQLNLIAGQKSVAASSFHSACTYFMVGVELLGDKWREENYDLAMQLFSK